MLRLCFLKLQVFLFLLSLLARPFCAAAENSPPLIFATTAAHLYARQEKGSEIITSLAKGEELLLLGQALSTTLWYMVKTPMGVIGWVQSADVSAVSSPDDPAAMGPDLTIFRSAPVPAVVYDQSGVIAHPGYSSPIAPEEQKANGKNIDVQRKEGRSNVSSQVIIDQNVRNLGQCVARADAADQTRWNKTCAMEGKPRGCALLAPVAVDLDQSHRAAIDECYKHFPEH